MYSLITSNIVRKSIFDVDYATTKYTSEYPHMYGIAKSMSNVQAKIITMVNDIFIVRKERASAIDGDWSLCLEIEWDNYLNFLAIYNNLEYPWFKIWIINSKRKVRYNFGRIVSLIVGEKLKTFIKKNILKT